MRLKTGSFTTACILGAGATRGTLRGTKSPRIKPPLNRDYFDILNKFIRTKQGKKYVSAWHRLKNFLHIEIGKKGVADPTMEQVFNILFLSKDLPEIFRKEKGRTRVSGFRQEIKDFLSLLIKIFHFVQSNNKNHDNLKHYDLLAGSLANKDSIITLNYDTLVDNALVRAGWNPKHGYGFKATKIKYEGIPSKPLSSQLREVVLLKPHGSFNWFAKGTLEKIEQVLEQRPAVSKIVISDLPKLYESKRNRLVRFFIPPLYTKFFKNKFWSRLWVQTYQALKKADRLIIIGCSLIATDYHLRAILSKAISDKNGRYKEIIIVDPSNETQLSLKKFFRGRSIKGCKIFSSFSDFCRRSILSS